MRANRLQLVQRLNLRGAQQYAALRKGNGRMFYTMNTTLEQRRTMLRDDRCVDWLASEWAEIPHLASDALYTLGCAAAFGNARAKAYLTDIARSSHRTHLPAQYVLNDFRRLQHYVTLGYSFAFVDAAGTYSQQLLAQVQNMIAQGVPQEEYVAHSWALGNGPLAVLSQCTAYFDDTKVSDLESVIIDSHFHDAFVGNKRVLTSTLPRMMELAPDEFSMCLLRGANATWRRHIQSALGYARIEALAHGVMVSTSQVHGFLNVGPQCDLATVDLVLTELINNAVKYRDPSKDKQRIQIAIPTDGSVMIVEDNGIGIVDTERVWDTGYREERNNADGTGLGLASARRRLERIGWSIGVESQPGQWTRFTLTPKDGDVSGGYPSAE